MHTCIQRFENMQRKYLYHLLRHHLQKVVEVNGAYEGNEESEGEKN